MRKNNKDNDLIEFYINNLSRLILPEQDCINISAYPNIKYLPFNYSVCPFLYKFKKDKIDFNSALDLQEPQNILDDLLQNPVMLHYIGPLKPWNSFFRLKQGIWFRYLIEGGLFMYYLRKLPASINNRLKRYSVKRFIRKRLHSTRNY